MANSLKEMLDEQYLKEKEIQDFQLAVEKYLNQRDISNIIDGSIRNNFRFRRYYGDFQITFIPTQFGKFSGGNDSYEITIQATGTTNEAPNYLKAFIKEKSSFDYEFVISELDETNITKEEIFTFLKKSIEG